jgi:hypothetical protein
MSQVVPWGFRKLLVWIKDEYNNPEVSVTENGHADFGEINDTGRADYCKMSTTCNPFNAFLKILQKQKHMDVYQVINAFINGIP